MGRPKGSRDSKPRKSKRNQVCKYSDDCEKCPLSDCKAQRADLMNRHQFLSEIEMFGSFLTAGNEKPNEKRGKYKRK